MARMTQLARVAVLKPVAWLGPVLACALWTPPATAAPGANEVLLRAGVDAAAGGIGVDSAPDPGDERSRAWRHWLSRPPTLPFLQASYTRRGLWQPNLGFRVGVEQDSLEAAVMASDVIAPGLDLRAWARADALSGGTLLNHVVDGENRVERGFLASSALLGARAALRILPTLRLEAELRGRAWVFLPSPLTDRRFRLPQPMAALEPRLRAVWDQVRVDRTLGLWTGVAGVLELGADFRALHKGFGGLTGEPPDARNRFGDGAVPRRGLVQVQGAARLWRLYLRGGVEGGYGLEEDDLTRARIGGMSPFSLTMPGAAYAEFLADRFAATHLEVGVVPHRLLYTGLATHVCLFNDPHRAGRFDELGLLRGVAAVTRVGVMDVMQAELRVGGNPDVVRGSGRGGWGLMMAVQFAHGGPG